MKVAFVYDRVNKWGGAEQVLLTLYDLFPDAPLYTSVYNSSTAKWAKVFPDIIPSFLQRIPLARKRHDLFPLFMPIAFESLDLSDYDLVISVTSEAAKGIITGTNTYHICYCLTPTRYLWSGYEEYLGKRAKSYFAQPVVSYLRKWDGIAAQRPDMMVAISKTVADRIKRYYKRESEIIYPPVDTGKFKNINQNLKRDGYFLVVSRLVPYKKVELVVKVFNKLELPLVVVGTGSEENRLKKQSRSNIRFVGLVSNEEVVRHYQGSKALIFPQEEDFGIVAVEAQAAGKPVIAFRKGGATETIVEGKTGLFFDFQTEDALISALKKFNVYTFNPEDCIKNSQKFSKEKFLKEFAKLVGIHG